MEKKFRLFLLLALLLTAATGAWAQGPVDGTIAWSVGNEASATVSASIMDAISRTGVTTGSGLTVNTGRYFNTEMARYQPATANAGNVEGVMIEYTIEAVDGYKFKPTGVDYAAVKDGTDNASYSWSYTIDGVESAITDVSMDDVLRNNGSNSGTAQLMHNESITAEGCSVFTLRFYISNCGTAKKIGIANITISGSVSTAAPTGYTVSLKEGVKDADKWTVKVGEGEAQALPIGGLKGDGSETVTLQYTGRLKVKGVKATSEAAPEVTYTLLSAATTSDCGKVVCAAGHLHDAKTAVPDGCTAVGILGKVTETGHGLILALKNATNQTWDAINGWTSVITYAGTTLKVLPDDAARGTNLTSYTTLGESYVSNWAVAQKDDYEAIFTNLGSTKGNDNGTTYDDNVNAHITTGVGGTAISGDYWSATEALGDYAWYFRSRNWNYAMSKSESSGVRPVLGFGKEATPALSITSPSVGQVIGSDGKNYAYGSLPTGVTPVAKICYVSGSNGLALALTDEENAKDWSTAQTTCAAHTAPFTGGTWKLATKDEWSNMISAAGSFTALRDGFSSVGGTNIDSYYYWSSTEYDSDNAWSYYFDNGNWNVEEKGSGYYVRACLEFTVEQSAKEPATVTTVPTGAAIVGVGKTTALVSGGAADGGTLMYAVTTTNTKPTSTDGFSDAVPTAQSITASGKVYVWYYVKGDDTHSDSEIAATAIEVPVADIIWDATNISELEVYGTDEYEVDGVKLSGNVDDVDATWNNSTNPTKVGINFSLHESGGFTFTAPTGKKFTRIDMKPQDTAGWDFANLGSGWALVENNMYFTVTWTGSAASTVGLLTGANSFNGKPIISIVFYLSE